MRIRVDSIALRRGGYSISIVDVDIVHVAGSVKVL